MLAICSRKYLKNRKLNGSDLDTNMKASRFTTLNRRSATGILIFELEAIRNTEALADSDFALSRWCELGRFECRNRCFFTA